VATATVPHPKGSAASSNHIIDFLELVRCFCGN